MMVLEGRQLRSRLTGKIFEVKRIRDRSVVLESIDGMVQEWTDLGALGFFFEEAENQQAKPILIS